MSQDPAGAAVARVGGAGAVQVGGSGCRLCRAYPEEGPELGALLGPGAGGARGDCSGAVFVVTYISDFERLQPGEKK